MMQNTHFVHTDSFARVLTFLVHPRLSYVLEMGVGRLGTLTFYVEKHPKAWTQNLQI